MVIKWERQKYADHVGITKGTATSRMTLYVAVRTVIMSGIIQSMTSHARSGRGDRMTNEQAIYNLKQAKGIPYKHETLTYVIQALQADGEKTCVTCRNNDTYHCAECENKSDYEQAQADGDLISRQAVLDLAKLEPNIGFGTVIHTYDVERLPSVAIPDKTGHWINPVGDNAFCECCGRLNHYYGDYCKCCGAKMD